MAVFRRFADLEIGQVRSVYGPSGLLDRQVQIPAHVLTRMGRPAQVPVFVSMLDADNLLGQLRAQEVQERALARREVRLPEARRRLSWGQLSADERRVLLLSQKEYNSFRAQRVGNGAAPVEQPRAGNGAAAAQAPQNPAARSAPQAAANNDVGTDGGDDASDHEEDI